MTERVTDELAEKVTAAIAAGVSDGAMQGLKKKIDDVLYEIESDTMYRLKDAIAPELCAFVVEMAERTVTAILEGNEREMRRYLSCESRGPDTWTGRSTGYVGPNRDIASQHPIIHGKFFEQGCIKLRRDIVNAHRDLLTNERVLDLEDQVKSLIAQVNKADSEKAAMWERVRNVESQS